jgi:hypothetical protein
LRLRGRSLSVSPVELPGVLEQQAMDIDLILKLLRSTRRAVRLPWRCLRELDDQFIEMATEAAPLPWPPVRHF